MLCVRANTSVAPATELNSSKAHLKTQMCDKHTDIAAIARDEARHHKADAGWLGTFSQRRWRALELPQFLERRRSMICSLHRRICDGDV
jgi:hypothetical protein